MSRVDTVSHPCRPSQEVLLSPFSNDDSTNVNRIMEMYTHFCKVGDDITSGRDHYNFDITSSYTSLNGRYFDWANENTLNYDTTRSGDLIYVSPGMSILNNKLIELTGNAILNFVASDTHIDIFAFPSDGTGYAGLVWYFDEDIHSEAKIGLVSNTNFDISIMSLIWILKVVRVGSVTTSHSLLYEDVNYPVAKVVELPYWRNFYLNGGVIS